MSFRLEYPLISGRLLVNGNDFYVGNSSQNPSQLALKTDIPTVSQYVHPTEKQCSWNPDLSNYYTKSEVDDKVSSTSGMSLIYQLSDFDFSFPDGEYMLEVIPSSIINECFGYRFIYISGNVITNYKNNSSDDEALYLFSSNNYEHSAIFSYFYGGNSTGHTGTLYFELSGCKHKNVDVTNASFGNNIITTILRYDTPLSFRVSSTRLKINSSTLSLSVYGI